MKTKYYFLLLGVVLLLAACGKDQEVPARKINTEHNFILPVAQPLTDAQWEVVDAKKEEYKLVNPDIK